MDDNTRLGTFKALIASLPTADAAFAAAIAAHADAILPDRLTVFAQTLKRSVGTSASLSYEDNLRIVAAAIRSPAWELYTRKPLPDEFAYDPAWEFILQNGTQPVNDLGPETDQGTHSKNTAGHVK